MNYINIIQKYSTISMYARFARGDRRETPKDSALRMSEGIEITLKLPLIFPLIFQLNSE